MLVFKLLLTPLFIGLISLADRRWGATVGGWLVGLPLTSAPVTFFIALELSWLIGWGAFAASTFAFEQISVPLPLVFLGVIGSLLLVLVPT